MTKPPEIIVGVDGSVESVAALRSAVSMRLLTGAPVTALHVWLPPLTYGGYPLPPVDWRSNAHDVLASAVTAALGLGDAPVGQRVVEGHAARVLISAADVQDTLVLGSHSPGGFAGRLLGSVTEAVVAHARCAVVVIRGDSQPVWSHAGAARHLGSGWGHT